MLIEPHTDNPLRGILSKIASVTSFVVMTSIIKSVSNVPLGEIVFFRALFAALPLMVILAFRRELLTSFRTERLSGHFTRAFIAFCGMLLIFYSLGKLPLPEATTMTYTIPLLLVILSGIVLRERVGFYRWTAVMIGLIGVLVVAWPRLTLFTSGSLDIDAGLGTLAALGGAVCAAFAMLATRSLVKTESNGTIVLFVSLFVTALSLLTLPFGWVIPTPFEALLLISAGILGAVGQIFLTASYRHAHITVIAPFEYTSLLLSIALGLFIFGDIPTLNMITGGLIVAAAGLFIVFREHRLGLERAKARKVSTPHG